MYQTTLFVLLLTFFSCSDPATAKNGAPSERGAKEIVAGWFKELQKSVGGTSYEPKEINIVSINGDDKKATVVFKWNGLMYPPSTPDSDQTPLTVKDKMQTLEVEKKDGKWEVVKAAE